MPASLRLLVLSLLLVGTAAAEATGWDQVKVGMSAEEVVGLLGEPIFCRKGRGFETWTYEHGAEVLIYREVVGWTAPTADAQPGRSDDVWSHAPRRTDFYATLRAAVRAPAVMTVAKAAVDPRAAAGMGYEEYLQTYGRNKG